MALETAAVLAGIGLITAGAYGAYRLYKRRLLGATVHDTVTTTTAEQEEDTLTGDAAAVSQRKTGRVASEGGEHAVSSQQSSPSSHHHHQHAPAETTVFSPQPLGKPLPGDTPNTAGTSGAAKLTIIPQQTSKTAPQVLPKKSPPPPRRQHPPEPSITTTTTTNKPKDTPTMGLATPTLPHGVGKSPLAGQLSQLSAAAAAAARRRSGGVVQDQDQGSEVDIAKVGTAQSFTPTATPVSARQRSGGVLTPLVNGVTLRDRNVDNAPDSPVSFDQPTQAPKLKSPPRVKGPSNRRLPARHRV